VKYFIQAIRKCTTKTMEFLAAMTKNLSSKNIAHLTDPCGSADHRLRNIKLSFNKLVRNYI
jgi:hypothetical protein